MIRSSAATLALLALAAIAAGEQPQAQKASSSAKPADGLEPVRFSVVITSTPLGPEIDERNARVFNQTLFSRDDQIFHLLEAGISAGQHEGGGKSLEIRRFGYNLDHGGAAGGLRILVDNIVQNHSTQGHGQGYLGSLKSVPPELVGEVQLINGPFSAEHGDYSGLGVVQVRLRESMPHVWAVRLQGGSFHSRRGFLSYSPNVARRDAVFAYEGSHSDGPFLKPLDYRRDNISGNYTWRLDAEDRFGLKWNGGRNRFSSSGQIPLDEVAAGRLDRFGSLSLGDGGDVTNGRLGLYYRKEFDDHSVLKLDGFVERSLFDLYSNFTFFLNDPVLGDGIQQHDSRLSEGANVQYARSQLFDWGSGLLTAGGNYLATQTNVDLRQSINRDPLALLTAAHARISNGGGYLQESLTLAGGRLQLGGGLRWDLFRFHTSDFVAPEFSGIQHAAKLQPKAQVSFTPSLRTPWQVYFNYGRGISSLDARGVVRQPGGPRLATTDFYQLGTSHRWRQRVSLLADLFWIEASNQLVYIPDDGSLALAGPSRSYGLETRASFDLTRKLSLSGGVTKVLNGYFRNVEPRVYLDRAPRLTAHAALSLTNWRGWSGSLRLRAINHYRLDGQDPSVLAAGHTVFDLALSRRLRPGVELNFAVDNLLGRDYWETQNYFESRLPGQAPISRIHGTPAFGATVVVGMTFRFGEK